MQPKWIVNENGCWVWQGYLTRGYGAACFGDCRKQYVHRIMYIAKYGAIPPSMQIDHLCRNRACVNPDHLEAVLQVENLRRGVRVKLNMDKVQQIRERYQLGMGSTLGREFGVSKSTILGIVRNQLWRTYGKTGKINV